MAPSSAGARRAVPPSIADGFARQIVHSVELALQLDACGIACAIVFSPEDATCIRIAGLETIEVVALPEGDYEIWSTNNAPPDPAPLRVGLSLAEAVMFLSGGEGRA